MKILITTIIFAVILSSNATAASGNNSGIITSLYWYEGHNGVLIIQEGMSDLGACGRSDYFILDEGHPYFKEIYSLLLAAHISSHPLALTIDGCFQGISRVKHVLSTKS